jgi:hypothetical protein
MGAPRRASGGAFKLILQAFREMPGCGDVLCARHSYQQSLYWHSCVQRRQRAASTAW